MESKLVKLETSCTAMILPPTACVLWWPWRAVVRHSKKTFYSIGPWPSTGEKRYSGSASNTIRWNPEAQSAEMRIGMMMKYPGLSPMVRPSFRKSVRRISSTISIRLHILNEFRKIYLSQKNLKNRTNRKLETRWTFSTSSINARLGPVPITLSKSLFTCPLHTASCWRYEAKNDLTVDARLITLAKNLSVLLLHTNHSAKSYLTAL